VLRSIVKDKSGNAIGKAGDKITDAMVKKLVAAGIETVPVKALSDMSDGFDSSGLSDSSTPSNFR
ncbi:MAG: hypothetical protein N3D11_01805, partial [Candidatus Sumerlaeia bacterium]|nr:hypothetical protein [Candidatus Sumerlaeia bacterium]